MKIEKKFEEIDNRLSALENMLYKKHPDTLSRSLTFGCTCHRGRDDLELENVDVRYSSGEIVREYRVKCACGKVGPESPNPNGAVLAWNEMIMEEKEK